MELKKKDENKVKEFLIYTRKGLITGAGAMAILYLILIVIELVR